MRSVAKRRPPKIDPRAMRARDFNRGPRGMKGKRTPTDENQRILRQANRGRNIIDVRGDRNIPEVTLRR